jgi:hypothetical protein
MMTLIEKIILIKLRMNLIEEKKEIIDEKIKISIPHRKNDSE